MSIKSKAIHIYAKKVAKKLGVDRKNAVAHQKKCLQKLIDYAANTQFGKDHNFTNIKSAEDFNQAVPIRDYEALRPYIDKVTEGHSHVLWPGKPKYFAKTSGTTSGVKYIPISQTSIKNHINTARNAVLNYIAQTKNEVLSGKTIFLSGSPVLQNKEGLSLIHI